MPPKNLPYLSKDCVQCGVSFSVKRNRDLVRRMYCGMACKAIGESKHLESCNNRTVEYTAWVSMRHRCSPGNDDSCHYYDRGIRVCERWAESFPNFLSDMGRRPSNCRSLDRINNDGNYEPGNCRWATDETQSRNRRDNRIVTVNERSMTVKEWAEHSGIGSSTIIYRLNAGWAPYLAISHRSSPGFRPNKLTAEQVSQIPVKILLGVSKTELARELGVSVATIIYHEKRAQL